MSSSDFDCKQLLFSLNQTTKKLDRRHTELGEKLDILEYELAGLNSRTDNLSNELDKQSNNLEDFKQNMHKFKALFNIPKHLQNDFHCSVKE